MIPQLGWLVPKYQDLVIPFRICEEEPLSDFHLIDLAIRSELVLMRNQTEQINNLILKYIMKLSKLKNVQWYRTSFEIYFRRFERQSQSNQLSSIYTYSMVLLFETIETAEIDMNQSH